MGGCVCGLDIAFELDTADALEEIDVEPGAAELAVGDGAEAVGELASDCLGDVGVFLGAEIGGLLATGGEEGLGAEEGADVVCTERRVKQHCHRNMWIDRNGEAGLDNGPTVGVRFLYSAKVNKH